MQDNIQQNSILAKSIKKRAYVLLLRLFALSIGPLIALYYWCYYLPRVVNGLMLDDIQNKETVNFVQSAKEARKKAAKKKRLQEEKARHAREERSLKNNP